jgi:hypothetical protein
MVLNKKQFSKQLDQKEVYKIEPGYKEMVRKIDFKTLFLTGVCIINN